MASSGTVCLFVCFTQVVYIFFCCYWCQLDVLLVTSNYSPCCCNFYVIRPDIVIVVALPNHHLMGPWSSIFPLNCYSWPHGDICKDLWSIIVCVISTLPVNWFYRMLVIILYAYWFPIYHGHYTAYQMIKQQCCWTKETLPSSVIWICSNAMWMSPPESTHFYSALNEFDAGSDLSVTLVWYADDTVWSMLSLLQKLLNFSETKLVPVSDINLCSIPYSINMTFVVVVKLSVDNPSILFITGNLL